MHCQYFSNHSENDAILSVAKKYKIFQIANLAIVDGFMYEHVHCTSHVFIEKGSTV